MPNRGRLWRRRWLLGTVVALGVMVAVWLAWAIVVIGNPALADPPTKADAIVVLGPSNQRVDQALDVARQLDIDTVVLSIGDFPGQSGTCTQPDVDVICFTPDPYTTSGEAAKIGLFAAENDWQSVIVIASKPQAARAAWLTERCFDGELQLVAATNAASNPSLWGWAFQLGYQSAAWIEDWFTATCAEPAPLPDGVVPA